MWVSILLKNAILKVGAFAVVAAESDMQYAGLRQHCVLYIDVTRTLYRMRAELLAQIHRKVKRAAMAEKSSDKLAVLPKGSMHKDLRTLWPR